MGQYSSRPQAGVTALALGGFEPPSPDTFEPFFLTLFGKNPRGTSFFWGEALFFLRKKEKGSPKSGRIGHYPTGL
jgi:hypothetical protein